MIMKRYLNIIISVLGTIWLVSSCSMEAYDIGNAMSEDPDANADFTAILTVKKTPTDSVYFQLNDSTTIYASNFQNRFTRMERVICGINITNTPVGRFKYKGYINWIETLDEGVVTSDCPVPGTDGLDIIDDWMTGVEDGFLTLHYSTWWGSNTVRHDFYLVTGANAADPYEVALRHASNGDKKDEFGDSLICFDINSLPDTGGQYKILTLKWTTSGGEASEKKFKFKTRK